MIYRFRMITDEDESFLRDIEIRGEQTFYDFHECIMEELNFDKGQIASFFLSNENWEKKLEFTLMDMTDPVDGTMQSFPMDKARIGDYINAEKQHLMYVFDFFSERMFFIQMCAVREDNMVRKYPVVVERRGLPPEQIKLDDARNIDLDDIDFNCGNEFEDPFDDPDDLSYE